MSTWKITRSFVLPLVVLVLVPWAIHTWFDPLLIRNTSSVVIGMLLLLIGLSFLAWTNALFVAYGNGTLAPWDPTQKLVVMGPYRFVRNPMIIGVITVLLGETILFTSFHLLGWTILFALINHSWLIFWEERRLKHQFGEAYLKYKHAVPRWIPMSEAAEIDFND